MTRDELVANIAKADEIIKIYQEFEKLLGNRLFKKFIMEGYLKDEVIRNMSNMVYPHLKESAETNLLACSGFNSYLEYKKQEYNTAIQLKAQMEYQLTQPEELEEEEEYTYTNDLEVVEM